jgi:hypothetical protein
MAATKAPKRGAGAPNGGSCERERAPAPRALMPAALVALCLSGGCAPTAGLSGPAARLASPAFAPAPALRSAGAVRGCPVSQARWCARPLQWTAVAAAERSDVGRDWRGSREGAAGAGATTGVRAAAGSRTRAMLKRQGKKWEAEGRKWAVADDSGRSGPRGQPAGAGELHAGSYVRPDLVEFLSRSPVFGASLGNGGRAPAAQRANAKEQGGESSLGGVDWSYAGAKSKPETAVPLDGASAPEKGARGASGRNAAASLETALRSHDVTLGGAASELLGELESLQAGPSVGPIEPLKSEPAQAPAHRGDVRAGRVDLAEEEEELLGYVIGGDDDPEVRALLMDVFSEEAGEDPMLSNMGWENELLRDVFAQNPLTRKSSRQALQPGGGGTSLTEMEGEESWELEMRNLFAQSPLTRPREADDADDETRA